MKEIEEMKKELKHKIWWHVQIAVKWWSPVEFRRTKCQKSYLHSWSLFSRLYPIISIVILYNFFRQYSSSKRLSFEYSRFHGFPPSNPTDCSAGVFTHRTKFQRFFCATFHSIHATLFSHFLWTQCGHRLAFLCYLLVTHHCLMDSDELVFLLAIDSGILFQSYVVIRWLSLS